MKLVNILTQKKGQISLFIIIGLIILMMFAALYYLINSLAEARIEKEVRKTTSSVLTTSTMQYYAGDILREVLKEGLITLGRQAGYFYENQPGYEFYDLPAAGFQDADVSYLIYPLYPKGYYNSWWPCLSTKKECHFSIEELDPDEGYCCFGSSVLPLLAAKKSSIKSQLIKYIEEEFQKRLNFTQLSEQFPGYNISGGEIETDINFGALSVNAELNYPIIIQFQDYEPILEIYKFNADVPVRFSKIYDIADKMINKEIRFLNSSPRKHYNTELQQHYPEISFRLEEQGYDDIFIINDSYSQIDGRNYIFQFARKNRPPVLDYIGRSPSYLYNKSGINTELYDYLAVPIFGLDQININPSAIDPDEDPVFYSSNSNIADLNYPNFNSTLNLSYKVNESDIGFHNITVTATDFNFSDLDRQEIRLLVDRPLRPNATLFNLYGGNTSHIYSKEDPFFLNATPSTESLDPFAAYTFFWNDVYQQEMFMVRTNYNCTVLPTGEDCSDYEINIENITEYDAKNYLPITGTNPKDILLTANLSYSELSQEKSATIPVVRKECIPYRSDSVPPYPYNGFDPTDIRAFSGDHACCNDDGTIRGTDTICHRKFNCEGVAGLKKRIWQANCSGTRGNICDGNETDAGISDICGCGAAKGTSCDGIKAFGLNSGQGWCYDEAKEGCRFCDKEIVDIASKTDANTQVLLIDSSFECGCGSGGADNGKPCDANADGLFKGKCGSLLTAWSCLDDT
jgi:hypothetical protein